MGDSSDEEDGEGEMVNVGARGGTRASRVSRYADQPVDVREGVQAAYASLSRNVTEAAQTILAVPMEVYERSGDSVSVEFLV